MTFWGHFQTASYEPDLDSFLNNKCVLLDMVLWDGTSLQQSEKEEKKTANDKNWYQDIKFAKLGFYEIC